MFNTDRVINAFVVADSVYHKHLDSADEINDGIVTLAYDQCFELVVTEKNNESTFFVNCSALDGTQAQFILSGDDKLLVHKTHKFIMCPDEKVAFAVINQLAFVRMQNDLDSYCEWFESEYFERA